MKNTINDFNDLTPGTIYTLSNDQVLLSLPFLCQTEKHLVFSDGDQWFVISKALADCHEITY